MNHSPISRLLTALLALLLIVSLCACDINVTVDPTTTADNTTTATMGVDEPTQGDEQTTTVVDETTILEGNGATVTEQNETTVTEQNKTTTTKQGPVTVTEKDNATTTKNSTTTKTDKTSTKKDNTVTTKDTVTTKITTVKTGKTTTVTTTKKPVVTTKSPITSATTSKTEASNTSKSATTTTADDPTAIKARTYALKDIQNRINFYGRTAEFKNGLIVDHVGAGIEFTAYVEGEVKLSISQTTNASMTSYYTVWIDGVRQEERLMANKRSFGKFTIANFAEGGVHTIRVLKQNELGTSISVFKDLSFTGYLMDVAEKRDLYIEFLGDSITSGYGNMMYVDGIGDPNATPVSAVNSDGTRAWAFLAAEKLNARSTIISDSGIGVVYEHGLVAGRRMSNFWKYISFARQDLGQFYSTDAPDLMVINLGTNDKWNNIADSEMITGVKDLIEQVRSTYAKDIPIVWCGGMMYDAKEDAVKKALKELGGTDNGLYYLRLNADGSGGGGHPGPESHEENATKLVNYLKSNNLV